VQDRVEPHPERRRDATRHRPYETMLTRGDVRERGDDRACGGRLPGAGHSPLARDGNLACGHQPQRGVGSASDQQARIEITITLLHAEMQTPSATVPARADPADHRSRLDSLADSHQRIDRFVRRAHRPVVDDDHAASG
jgi:hypothetical protein